MMSMGYGSLEPFGLVVIGPLYAICLLLADRRVKDTLSFVDPSVEQVCLLALDFVAINRI